MKKLLAIVVLGLLWSGNAYSENKSYQGKHGSYSEGTMKISFCEQEWPAGIANAFCRKASVYFENGIEVNDSWSSGGKKRYAIFKDVTVPVKSGTWKKQFGNGTFHAIAYSWPEAQKIISELKSGKSLNATSGTSTNDKITQSKQICKDLGFKPNNEKFADCALKMMSLQFEASNKQVATGGGTQQQIIIKEQQDYNIFDAMIDLSLLNTAINSAPTSNNTNCRVVKKHWGADLICR